MDDHRELDELIVLLGECLGRIDEGTYRIQVDEDPPAGLDVAGDLDQETTRLQLLLSRLLDHGEEEPQDRCDLLRTLERALQSTIAEVGFPLVLRSQLAANLPPIACRTDALASAVQRALQVGATHAGAGGQLQVTTRREGNRALLELAAQGGRDPNARQRVATLAAFVADFGGACRAERDEQGGLLLLLDLPLATTADELAG